VSNNAEQKKQVVENGTANSLSIALDNLHISAYQVFATTRGGKSIALTPDRLNRLISTDSHRKD
jgi:hypothetical protein